MWSLISAVGIFCLGSGATIVHGVQNLWNPGVQLKLIFAACSKLILFTKMHEFYPKPWNNEEPCYWASLKQKAI